MNTILQVPALSNQKADCAEIVKLHEEIGQAFRVNVPKAIRIGKLLVAQKARLEHGQWLPWIKANLPFSQQTANNYVHCYEHRDKLLTVGNLELTNAYRLLAPPPEPKRLPPRPDEDVLAELFGSVLNFEERLIIGATLCVFDRRGIQLTLSNLFELAGMIISKRVGVAA